MGQKGTGSRIPDPQHWLYRKEKAITVSPPAWAPPVHVEDSDLVPVAGAVLEGDDLRLALLARDLHNGGEVVGGGRHHTALPVTWLKKINILLKTAPIPKHKFID